MPEITLKGGFISYYGNPAGYTEKEKAVVDNIFRCDELSAFLQDHGLSPRWTDGVMERLATGERPGGIEASSPLKNVRIWQLNPDVDVFMKFVPYEELVRQFGKPSPDNYHIAYDGQLGTNDLEDIFNRCNTNHPPGYNGHSLSMSDIIELYDGSGSEFHYCDRFGFQPISFGGSEQARTMDTRSKRMEESIMPETPLTHAVQEEAASSPLQYDVRIYPTRTEGAQKARATVNLNGAFALTNIRVMEGSKGLFVSMPQYRGANGEYKDICFPCSKASRAAFDRAVLGAYEQTMAQSQSAPQKQEAPAPGQEQSQPVMGGM